MFGLLGMDSQNLINVRGGFTIIESNKKFHDDLKILLETKRGTLVGDPDYGSRIYEYLYEPANETTASLLRTEVDLAISKYFSNYTVNSIDVHFKDKTVALVISYSIVNSNVTDSITLEFIRGW